MKLIHPSSLPTTLYNDSSYGNGVVTVQRLLAKISEPTFFWAMIAILLWVACGYSMIIFNKLVLSTWHFNYPFFLTAWHTFIATCATQILSFVMPSTLPGVMEGKVTRKVYFETLLPAAFCFVGGVVLGNFAYTFITVGYIQMIKAITPVPLFLLYVIRGREHPSFLQLAILATISGGVMIASVGELQFSWIGCIIQVAAVCCDCLRVVTTDSFIKDSKIDSLSVLYYIAPTSCVAVTVGWYLWEAKNIPWSVFTPTFSLILLANGLLAFALNFAALFAMKTSSGMIMSICGPVKDFIVIISSSWMFGAPVTWLQWFGFGISITGIFLYQQYKQDPVVLTEKVDQFCLRPLLTVIRTVVPSETRVEKDAEREGLVMSFQELNKNDEDMRENDA